MSRFHPSALSWRSPVGLAAAVITTGFITGCDDGDRARKVVEPRAPADAVPAATEIAGSPVTTGVELGTLRRSHELSAFRISTWPTTVAEYRRCVDAGVCGEPSERIGSCAEGSEGKGTDQSTYYVVEPGTPGDNLPVSCVTSEQATRFCRWVGGTLPSAAEWLLAARGPQVRRFAWGGDPPDCTRHWRVTLESTAPNQCCKGECDVAAAAVGKHSAGSSPSGIEDVLSTLGEHVIADPEVEVLGCRGSGTACYVTGNMPGAIDSVLTLPQGQAIPSGFRCVWREE